jgi:hypothetical protein
MTFGSRAWICVHAAVALVFCFGAQSPVLGDDDRGWGLEELLQGLSHVKSATTAYTEDQYLGLLTRPLHSSGVLVYVAPGRLEKDTLTPTRNSVIIDGDTLTFRAEKGRERAMPLAGHPEIGSFIESLRSTLNGDLASLMRLYRIDFTGMANDWILTLIPSDQKVRKLVRTVRITGTDYDLRSVEITYADGDRSVMIMQSGK